MEDGYKEGKKACSSDKAIHNREGIKEALAAALCNAEANL